MGPAGEDRKTETGTHASVEVTAAGWVGHHPDEFGPGPSLTRGRSECFHIFNHSNIHSFLYSINQHLPHRSYIPEPMLGLSHGKGTQRLPARERQRDTQTSVRPAGIRADAGVS